MTINIILMVITLVCIFSIQLINAIQTKIPDKLEQYEGLIVGMYTFLMSLGLIVVVTLFVRILMCIGSLFIN